MSLIITDKLSDSRIPNRCGITIGNFDGVHLGHRQILKEIIDECDQAGLELVVVTFLPHPREILTNAKHFLLNSYEDRRELLASVGVKYLVETPFTRDFSTMEGEDFLNTFLTSNERFYKFFLGYDFSFGSNKSGDSETVKKFCEDHGFEYKILSEVKDSGNVSSSRVRKLIIDGKMKDAAEKLGRAFYTKGKVIKGEQRGRQIGFPTANQEISDTQLIPTNGVYHTKVFLRGQVHDSITNIGKKPTFKEDDTVTVETFILNFDDDIYGEEIVVEFLERLRNEKKFNSIDELKAQIKEDVEKRKVYS